MYGETHVFHDHWCQPSYRRFDNFVETCKYMEIYLSDEELGKDVIVFANVEGQSFSKFTGRDFLNTFS